MDESGGADRGDRESWPDRQFAAEIRAAQQGCRRSLGHLFQQFQAYLLHVANQRVNRGLRAKIAPSSVVQYTLLQLSQNFQRFNGTTAGQLKAWMRGALLRNVADANRKFRYTQMRDLARETSLDQDSQAQSPQLVDGSAAQPCDDLIAAEAAARLAAALARLSERHRKVIQLRNWEDQKWSDVGRELGCTEDAARQIWARAIVRLKEVLRDNELPDG